MTLSAATEFRDKGKELAKKKETGFKGVYFGLCTTVGTRVRCDVSKVQYQKERHYCYKVNNTQNFTDFERIGRKGDRERQR